MAPQPDASKKSERWLKQVDFNRNLRQMSHLLVFRAKDLLAISNALLMKAKMLRKSKLKRML